MIYTDNPKSAERNNNQKKKKKPNRLEYMIK